MGTTWPEKSSTNRKKLIDELLRGREFASQLQILLHEPFGDHGSAEELIGKISTSFTETLSALIPSQSGEVCQKPATCHEGSAENRKTSGLKDRRSGVLKRRNRSTSGIWTMVSPSTEDGYAWRKYGQKEILNSKYPRSYFRCTRKNDRGCRATKQVQRINEGEPHVYQTTYIGHHTCNKDALIMNQITSQYSHPGIGFDSTIFIEHNDHYNHYPTSPLVKKEPFVSDLSSELSPNSVAFESFAPPAEMGSDSAAYSCSATSYQDSDMDFLVGSDDCDNYFHFDGQTQFL